MPRNKLVPDFSGGQAVTARVLNLIKENVVCELLPGEVLSSHTATSATKIPPGYSMMMYSTAGNDAGMPAGGTLPGMLLTYAAFNTNASLTNAWQQFTVTITTAGRQPRVFYRSLNPSSGTWLPWAEVAPGRLKVNTPGQSVGGSGGGAAIGLVGPLASTQPSTFVAAEPVAIRFTFTGVIEATTRWYSWGTLPAANLTLSTADGTQLTGAQWRKTDSTNGPAVWITNNYGATFTVATEVIFDPILLP
ncbi:hypothetical protein [Deinococcus peraridilitoris]|uniref:Uncharacterized protein n=1 Tax=Deinococcus peraridilitoris (strain DSM 19664 / LMG 22246 / CIP 109416 / KR-200) TaxID=937777 RepID=K9ZZE8_DEIPD|nr:hypothetical protein [Deinococcus peraridilitoris]AFZ66976.1 hypothetical protein Deipe_1435 [Deinococcus peraridilitoris DSM 19664]